jgi:hypothetical protein
VGYIASGWAAEGLPAAALGFVYLPALAALVLASHDHAAVARLGLPVLRFETAPGQARSVPG